MEEMVSGTKPTVKKRTVMPKIIKSIELEQPRGRGVDY